MTPHEMQLLPSPQLMSAVKSDVVPFGSASVKFASVLVVVLLRLYCRLFGLAGVPVSAASLTVTYESIDHS